VSKTILINLHSTGPNMKDKRPQPKNLSAMRLVKIVQFDAKTLPLELFEWDLIYSYSEIISNQTFIKNFVK